MTTAKKSEFFLSYMNKAQPFFRCFKFALIVEQRISIFFSGQMLDLFSLPAPKKPRPLTKRCLIMMVRQGTEGCWWVSRAYFRFAAVVAAAAAPSIAPSVFGKESLSPSFLSYSPGGGKKARKRVRPPKGEKKEKREKKGQRSIKERERERHFCLMHTTRTFRQKRRDNSKERKKVIRNGLQP